MRWVWTSLVVLVMGCSDDPDARCTPNETRACECASGTDGVQTCAADGTSFSVCSCCSATGASCTSAGACCSGACEQGRCCVGTGACQSSGECCTGTCIAAQCVRN